jgi:hypothetical protein
MMESVNDVWYKQRADRIPCCQERINQKHPKNVFAMSMEVLQSTEAPLVTGRKE